MKKQWRRRRAVLAGLGILFFTLAATPIRADGWLVLPFANQTGEVSLDWLGHGFAISMEEHLQAAGQTTVSHEKARGLLSEWKVPAGRSLTLASAIKAGEQAGAQRVVTGLFRLKEGEVQVEVQILDPDEPALREEVGEAAKLGDLFDLLRRLNRSILRAGENGLPAQQAIRDSASPPPLTAYEQYVRALIQPHAEQRLQALRQAAHAFPSYPILQYRLAEELHVAGRNEEALGSLERVAETRFALSPEARLLRAEILLERGDNEGAAKAAAAALDLRESYRGRLLRAEALLARGATEEARADLERARTLGAPTEDTEALARRLGPPSPPGP